MTTFTKEQLLALGYSPFSSEEKVNYAIRCTAGNFIFLTSELELIAFVAVTGAEGSTWAREGSTFKLDCVSTQEFLCQYRAGIVCNVRNRTAGLFDPDVA
jgi:hypothetical protein